MKINAKKIIKKINEDKVDNERGPYTQYFNKKLYGQFKNACEGQGVPTSTVLEELMEEFLRSL